MLESLSLPALVLDAEGRILEWSPALLSLVKKSPKTGQPLAKLSRDLDSLWRANQPETCTLNDRMYLFCSFPLTDARWLLVLHSNEDNSLNLLSTIAHDLQNPLTAIKGYIELVVNSGPTTERQKHFSDRALYAIREMSELVGRLLDMSWLESNKPLQLEEVNLSSLAAEVSAGYTERARQREVTIILHLNPVTSVQAEERRIRQVVNNLISNAVKYSLQGGEIIVSTYEKDNRVTFEVRDQGIGIPPEYHEKIFQRFFRVPRESGERIEGNGLGLAISYEIVHRHSSELRVESILGEGSRFYFSLPIMG
jgi:signal transduction histidine kinase